MKRKKIWAVVLTFTLCLSLCSCKGSSIYEYYKELEKLELVKTVGVDIDGEDITVTACTGVGLKGEEPKILEKKAQSMADAMDFMQKNPSGGEPFYSHAESLIIGQTSAEKGIGGCLDYVARTTEMRTGTHLFVVRDGSAKELLESVTGKETAASEMLRALSENIAKTGGGFLTSCREVCANFAMRGNSLVLAIKTIPTDKYESDSEKMVVLAGFAVMKDGRLQGFLPEELSASVCLLAGEEANGRVTVYDAEDRRVVMSYSSACGEITPVFQDGKLSHIDYKIKCRMTIEQADSGVDLKSEQARKDLGDRVSAMQKTGAEEVIRLAKEMEIDFCDIGGAVRMKKPVKFDKLEKSWEELFPETEFQVSCETVVERTYDIKQPVTVSGSDRKGEDYEKQ